MKISSDCKTNFFWVVPTGSKQGLEGGGKKREMDGEEGHARG